MKERAEEEEEIRRQYGHAYGTDVQTWEEIFEQVDDITGMVPGFGKIDNWEWANHVMARERNWNGKEVTTWLNKHE